MERITTSKAPIDVVCAVIHIDGKIVATQRSEKMKLPLKWEFPGGKREAGESERDCLKREIKEELNVDIIIGERINSVEDTGADIRIRLIPYHAIIESGEIELSEHNQYILLDRYEILGIDWANADRQIAEEVYQTWESVR